MPPLPQSFASRGARLLTKLLIDGDDERLEQRYMETARRYL
jgi:hypothetical protein